MIHLDRTLGTDSLPFLFLDIMKNSDLIAKLQKLPMDAEVIVSNSNTMEQSGDKAASYVQLSEKGSVTQENTVDSFDGTNYSYDRWSTAGGDKKVITIH